MEPIPKLFFKLFFNVHHFLKSLLNLLQYRFCFMFRFLGREACRILTPRSGVQPAAPALEGGVLTAGPPGKSPTVQLFSIAALLHSAVGIGFLLFVSSKVNICEEPHFLSHDFQVSDTIS